MTQNPEMKGLTPKELLALIEFYTSVNEDPTGDEAKQIVGDIYVAVHSHRKQHSCYAVHESWRESTVKHFNEMPKEFI